MTMDKSTLGKIVSWRPFVAKGIYEADNFEYRFMCPKCKSRSAIKASHSTGNNFLEGYYQCANCGLREYEQKVIGGKIETAPITYYSDCFRRCVEKQLKLFPEFND